MQKPRLGCLTPIGLLASLITLLIIGGFSAVQGGAMFSPGELSTASGPTLGGVNSHAEIKGQCRACHAIPWNSDSMTTRCLGCHIQIQSELADTATLHGALVDSLKNDNCLTCHTEHLGPNGILTLLEDFNFPHDATGFSLLAHAAHPDDTPFVCADCHSSDLTRLDQDICANCHLSLDEVYLNRHIAAFGQDCLACHDGVDIFSNFSHDLTRFALSGKHAEANCLDCHKGNISRQQLQATPTDCASCHSEDDAHQGEFGAICGECHSTDGWLPATFDHNRTDFPLTGAHQNISCDSCHAGSIHKGTPSQCGACHAEPTFHAGLFEADCATCHTTSAWLPVNYTEPHTFPLGHGEANSCRDCHASALSAWTCYTCHDQAEILQEHSEEGINDFNDCMRCHPDGREGDEGSKDEDD